MHLSMHAAFLLCHPPSSHISDITHYCICAWPSSAPHPSRPDCPASVGSPPPPPSFFTDARLLELTPLLDPSRPSGLDYYPLTRPGERFPVNDPGLQPRLTPRPDDDAAFLQGVWGWGGWEPEVWSVGA